MSGISPKLPLHRDSEDGYALNKTRHQAIIQNIKNIVLTNPGERIMIPDFGSGIRHHLFEPNNVSVYPIAAANIKTEVERWLPFVEILDVQITNSTHIWTLNGVYEMLPDFKARDVGDYELRVSIFYNIEALGLNSSLDVGV